MEILVQLPIPKHIDGLKIINAISAEKDVDGFHTTNIGKMMIGDETGFFTLHTSWSSSYV